MYKLGLEKAEEPQIKLPTFLGSQRKQGNSRITFTSDCLTILEPLTVWITENSGKFLKRWKYQTTFSASREICMWVQKQQFKLYMKQHQFNSVVQSLSCVRLFVTPWNEAHQASMSITNSQSLLKLMSIESVMPSNHLVLCHSLLLLPSVLPRIRVFSTELVLHIRWPKYWSFSFSISPSNE